MIQQSNQFCKLKMEDLGSAIDANYYQDQSHKVQTKTISIKNIGKNKNRNPKTSIIRLKIDLINKKREMVVKNIADKFNFGPFEGEVIISGNYNLLNLKGRISCDLSLSKPFELSQSINLVDSLLKIQYKTFIVKLFESFLLPFQNDLSKCLANIELVVEFRINVIQKYWGIGGSLKSNQCKFNIFTKEFAVKQIGLEISGKKSNVEVKRVYLSIQLDSIPLMLVHSFGNQYLFEAYMEMIPFGQMISNLTQGFDDPFDASSILKNIQLHKNQLKFKDLNNIKVKSSCNIGSCETGIKSGKFQSIFLPQENFRFKNICQEITFLDQLHLQKIQISVSNRNDLSRGLSIKGFLPIIKSPVLMELTKILYSKNKQDFYGIPFSLIIINMKQICAKVTFLQNFNISENIVIKSLDLLIKPSLTLPQFGLEGQIQAQICDKNFGFKLSCLINTSITLTAELIGIWDEPFGLRNCYIKDLLLSIGYMNFAIKGQLKIGEMKAEAAVSYDNINPARNMVYFDIQSFQLAKILSVFNVQLPKQIADILNEINIKKLSAYMVPPGGIMLGSTFYQQGFSAKLDCQVFGFKAKFQLTYKKNKFQMYGQIDPITIPNILYLISSRDLNKGPFFDVKLGYSATSHLKIDGCIYILDMYQQEVYGIADIQGITFYTSRAIKIFGMSFIQNSFRFRAGLLKISNDLLVQAVFKTDMAFFQYIEVELKKIAEKASEPFYQAERDLNRSQQKLNQRKIYFDSQCQTQKYKFQIARQQYERVLRAHQDQARAVFESEKARVSNILYSQQQNAKQKMENAKNDAWRAHQNEQRRAEEQLNDEKNRAERDLQRARKDITDSFRGPQRDVDSIMNTIRQFQGAPWYELHKKAALGPLYAAYGTSKGVLIAAEETSKAGLVAAEFTYKGFLEGSKATYWVIVQASKATCNASLIAADQTYYAALQSVRFTYNQSINQIQCAYQTALNAAVQLGNAASYACTAAFDAAFNAVKLSFDAAFYACQAARGVVEGARITCRFALTLLAELIKSISSALNINQLFFEFDMQKKRVIVKIDLIVIGRELKKTIEVSFEQILHFFTIIVNQIWGFISSLH